MFNQEGLRIVTTEWTFFLDFFQMAAHRCASVGFAGIRCASVGFAGLAGSVPLARLRGSE